LQKTYAKLRIFPKIFFVNLGSVCLFTGVWVNLWRCCCCSGQFC